MKNILTIALLGGGALLAWDYFRKRNRNQALLNGVEATDLEAAEMEEEGEEGGDVVEAAMGQQLGQGGSIPVTAPAPTPISTRTPSRLSAARQGAVLSTGFVDDWDSSPVSYGL